MKRTKGDNEKDKLVVTDIFEDDLNSSNEKEKTKRFGELDDLFAQLSEETAEAPVEETSGETVEETSAEDTDDASAEVMDDASAETAEAPVDEGIPLRESDGKKRKREKKKPMGRALKVSVIVIAVLVVGLGAVIAAGLTVVNSKLDKITRVQVDREALGIDPRVAEELKDYRNIALLGIDSRDINDDSNSRSDAMIVASLHKETGKIKLLSIYRDTYLSLGDDYGLDKLTHAYFYGGAVQTLQSINRNLDLNCEEVVVVNWKTVADAVDALGGLEIDVKKSEIREMNKYIRDTKRSIGGSGKRIKKAGKQTLNGNQAVTYARIRKDSSKGDHRRNERMEIVVEAAFEKAKTLSLKELNAITDQALPQLKTNMTTNQMMELMVGINKYTMGEGGSWPYQVKDWTYNNIWYGPPVSLTRNVTQLHEKYFNQKDYDPTDTVKTISDSISSLTGW